MYFLVSLLSFLADCQTPLPCICIFSNYIRSPVTTIHPLSFALVFSTALHLIKLIYHVSTNHLFPSLRFASHFLLPACIAVPCHTHLQTTIFAVVTPTEINLTAGRPSRQKLHCVPVTSAYFLHLKGITPSLFPSSLLIICREQFTSAEDQPVSGALGG